MKRLMVIILSITLLSGCMAAVIGGAGVGAYYMGKYYGSKQEAYRAYYYDSIQRGITPLDYQSWKKIQ